MESSSGWSKVGLRFWHTSPSEKVISLSLERTADCSLVLVPWRDIDIPTSLTWTNWLLKGGREHACTPQGTEGPLAGTVKSSFSVGFFTNELLSRSVGVLLPCIMDLDSKFHSEQLRSVP